MINIKNLSVCYGKKKAIDSLTLDIEKGESVFLAGANGSGKTTFLRCVAGVLFPDGGNIYIDDRKVGTGTRGKTAYIPASISFYDGLKVKEVLREMKT